MKKTLITKIVDNNFVRVTSEKAMEKCVAIDAFRLVFTKSMADRFKTSKRVNGLSVYFILNTLDRMMEIYGSTTLVRRFRTGDFAVILPFFFVVACDIDVITQETLLAGQLVFAIKKAAFKCLIPCGVQIAMLKIRQ